MIIIDFTLNDVSVSVHHTVADAFAAALPAAARSEPYEIAFTEPTCIEHVRELRADHAPVEPHLLYMFNGDAPSDSTVDEYLNIVMNADDFDDAILFLTDGLDD